MSIKAKLLKIKKFFFGVRTLADFKELSAIDEETGTSFVHEDRSGKVYVRRNMKEYDLARYKYLKKRPVAHTPRIVYFEEFEGGLGIIERHISGESLEFCLQKKGLMDENKVIDHARQLCDILSDYHRCKPAITKHDLNPGNVVVSVNGVVSLLEAKLEKYSRPDAKVTDLPEAQRYKAPEEAEANAGGVPANIYSMGVLMNVLLCGKHPDDQLAEGCLTDIIKKCVSPEPGERFQSAQELREALTAVKKSLPFSKRLSSRNLYLIPGLRSKNIYISFFALVAYPMLAYVCLFLNFEGAGAMHMISRVIFFLAVLASVFFNGNYLDVRRKLPLTRARRGFFRALGILLYNAVLLLVTYGLLLAVSAVF